MFQCRHDSHLLICEMQGPKRYPNSQVNTEKGYGIKSDFSKLTDQQLIAKNQQATNLVSTAMKQQVMNYESDVIEREFPYSQSHFRIYDPRNHRYSTWNLSKLIEMFVNRADYGVKWIGCDSNAHVLAFFYCMLMGCLSSAKSHDDLFMRFKYSLYQESKQALSIAEQKIFVEHLGLIEDSKNIGEFLKKSSHLQGILIKLFSYRCSQMTRKQLKSNNSVRPSKMQELQWYSAIFPFNNFTTLNQKCSSLSINHQTYFIMEEKECFFVLEEIPNQLTSCRISEVSTRKKATTEVYGRGLQYIDSLKTFELLESGHETTNDKNKSKGISNSQSKQLIQMEIPDRKPIKTQHSPLNRLREVQKSIHSKNNFFGTKKKIGFMQQSLKVNGHQSKRDLIAQEQKKIQLQDLRTSIRDARYHRVLGTPKISSQRASLQKDEQNKSKPKVMGKNNHAMLIEMPQILELVSINQNRQDFIYQSLNPSEQLFELKKSITPTHVKRIPKFLAKKHEDPVPYTFSSSPIKHNPSPEPRHPPKKHK